MNWSDRAKQVLKNKGWSTAELGRRTGITYDTLYKQLREVDQPRGDVLKRIATALSVNEYWLRTGDGLMVSEIPLAGFVSAGEAFVQLDDLAGALDPVPIEFGDNPIAAEVRSTSMVPVYRPGDRVIGDKLSGEARIAGAVNRDCIVMTANAEGYLKRFTRGARVGLYTLRSYNPDFSDIENVRVQWVAPITWLRRG